MVCVKTLSRETADVNKPFFLFVGPISSLTVLGQTFIIINDSDIAFELMRDRSAIHSSRPEQVFSKMYVKGKIIAYLADHSLEILLIWLKGWLAKCYCIDALRRRSEDS